MSYACISVLQPAGSGDTSVYTVDSEPHLEAVTLHVAGCLGVLGAYAAAEVHVLIKCWFGDYLMLEELVEALRRQPGMMQTALTLLSVSHARVVTSLGQGVIS